MTFDSGSILAFTPLLILIGMGCIVLLAETFVRGQSRAGLAWLGVAACIVALLAVVLQWPEAAETKSYFDSMLAVDRMSLYLDGAFIVAERLRAEVEEQSKEWEIPITISMGISTYPAHGGTNEELLISVEKAAKYSKDNGKNQITVFDG